MRLPLAWALAVVLAAAPALAAPGDVHWDSRLWELRATGLPPAALAERPDWADRQITLDGKILWVAAVVPASVGSWSERILQGTRQAEMTLTAFSEYLVRARTASDPVDYQDRHLTSLRHRLKSTFDREGFVKVETTERPRAIWMRFGYPAERLEYALGFAIPGVLPLRHPRPEQVASEPASPLMAWDYVWELSWIAGIATVTAVAVLFAQAASQ